MTSAAARIDQTWEQLRDPSHRRHSAQRERVLWIAKHVVGSRVLEVGCGGGGVTNVLVEVPGVEIVVAIDVDAQATRLAHSRLKKRSNLIVATQDLTSLSTSPDTYDTVVCTEVLEHLKDPAKAVRILRLKCEEGGHLIAGVPNGGGTSANHLHSFNKETFTKLLEGSGFTVTKMEVVHCWLHATARPK